MAAPTQAEVNSVLHTKNNAESAIDYAQSIKMEAQQKEGTRYKFIFNQSNNRKQ